MLNPLVPCFVHVAVTQLCCFGTRCIDLFRNFCDKMVTSFLPSFLSLILRQRRVNEMGTQQLLLDVYNLKTLMLKVPSLGTCPRLRFPRLLICLIFV